MNPNDKISFLYKGGRSVAGVVINVGSTFVNVKLETDYKGKNEDWCAGEIKSFNLKEMKNVKIIFVVA